VCTDTERGGDNGDDGDNGEEDNNGESGADRWSLRTKNNNFIVLVNIKITIII
jgi:hypothetical protein